MNRISSKRNSSQSMSEEESAEDKYESYVVLDGSRIPHLVKVRKGVHPSLLCENCE